MKKATPWMRARDWLGSLGGFLVVFGALIAVDERVGTHVRGLLGRSASGEVSAVTERFSALGQAIVMAARDQSIDHAPMLVFSAVAIVLVFFMVRT